VKSFSLHSSDVYFGGSNLWSRKDSDIDPPKSSIGEISAKISSRPEVCGTSWCATFTAASTRARHRSFPSNQSKLSIWSPSRSGACRGSWIFAKDTLREAVRVAMAWAV